ncbi:hypothetical protein ARMGADRAFT_1037740 [Armillaria gallica]|uniref:Uncharacterized protein n=1 Tax=Armillaria gallica TaxID=47427 RepID=A0A2H3CKK9_ARMGA|nr:hypothetical protein ARMGADRAFT_1037740 [Armillaria gallica]
MSFPLPPNSLPAPELYVFPCLQDDKNWLDKNGNFKTEELDLSPMRKNKWLEELFQPSWDGTLEGKASPSDVSSSQGSEGVSNPKGALIPMSRSVDTCSQAKVDAYIPWPGVNNACNINMPNMDPLVSPDFFQHLASIVEEKLVAHQNSSSLSLSSTVSTMTSPSTLPSPPALLVSECNGNTPVSSDDTAVNPIQCSLVFADGQVLRVTFR